MLGEYLLDVRRGDILRDNSTTTAQPEDKDGLLLSFDSQVRAGG
jgi:hypothetical protein